MTVSLVSLVVVSGIVGELRYEGICSLDVWTISVTDSLGFLLRAFGLWRIPITLTCPLGFVERSLAARELLPLLPSVALIVLSVILFGRVFCAWVCPSVILRRVFVRGNGALKSQSEAASKGASWASYSPYAVLGGVLLASYVFGFPVFCLFCPVGLFFGFLFTVTRFFSLDSPGLELVLFPLMLGLELWGFKSWCRSICPLGALLSIIGSLNPFLRPVVYKEKCLAEKSISCRVCERVCPEGIALESRSSRFSPNSCTKCLECSDKCPVKAIRFPLWA